MRRWWLAVAMAVGLMTATVGCTSATAGTAQRDPVRAPLSVSEDGFGVVAGFDNAPNRIEIFTEPQCSHCADLQADFGDQLAHYIDVGQVEVTYRPLTFLDDAADGHSARVSNALFLAADGDATGTQFQRFVAALWADQEPGGPGPSDERMAELARAAGMPEDVADSIADGGSAVDIADMDDLNFEFLFGIDVLASGTPTVYDLGRDEKLDIYDNDWLTKLVQS